MTGPLLQVRHLRTEFATRDGVLPAVADVSFDLQRCEVLGLVGERRLPWERPMAPAKLTPYRVRRVIIVLLVLLGTPASPPKPCGRSPGRPKGRRSGPAPRFPAIKKAA